MSQFQYIHMIKYHAAIKKTVDEEMRTQENVPITRTKQRKTGHTIGM